MKKLHCIGGGDLHEGDIVENEDGVFNQVGSLLPNFRDEYGSLFVASPLMFKALKRIAKIGANPLTTRKETTKILRLIRASDEMWQLACKAISEAKVKQNETVR